MAKALKSVRGMHDILPGEVAKFRTVEQILISTAESYGYSEIRTPIMEQLELFKRSAGETSDVVNKEMYTFIDQNQERLALRPEGTAACVRSGIEHGLFYGQKQRLFYLGEMFRRERPQKGRYRQFNQFGIEAMGFNDSYIEVEIIDLIHGVMQKLGLEPKLELNHLGSEKSRINFTKDLVSYLRNYVSDLDPDSQKRLTSNPLRILDTKDTNTIKILQGAPSIQDYLADEDIKELNFIKDSLSDLGINFKIEPKLVRGLDYYTGMVFEWQLSGLTICAGGRYDNLIEELGGKTCPAVGVAIGLERLIEASNITVQNKNSLSILCNYLPAYQKALSMASELREINYSVTCEFHEFKLKPLLKLANQIKSRYVILLGEQEYSGNKFVLKDMREGKTQEFSNLIELINNLEAAYV